MLAIPFAWVAAMGLDGDDDRSRGFARIMICTLGVLGCLEAFPTAGSQIWWSALSMVPVGLLCISDGFAIMGAHPRRVRWRDLRDVRVLQAPIGTLLVGALITLLVWGNVGELLVAYRGVYRIQTPTRLAGAAWVRLPEWELNELQSVTTFLKRRCSTFQSLPGMDSFYFFSGETPPTGLNASNWMNLFNPSQNTAILNAMRHIPRLCVLENSELSLFWDEDGPLVQTPVVRYMEDNFVVVEKVGPYSMLVRKT